ncbi:GTPase, partial [Singulisphaera rosea]
RRLISGWRVVLAGRPNVGKSRLLNALAGYDRAIVDPTPGTTRDVVSVRTAVEGWPIVLDDTAGLRNSDDAVEQSGIALSRSQHESADLLLVVLDRSQPLTGDDHRLISDHSGSLLIANKADLPAAWQPAPDILEISAERGDGLDTLIRSIAGCCIPDPPEVGAAIPFRPRHIRGLELASHRLKAGDPIGAREALEGILVGDLGSTISPEVG